MVLFLWLCPRNRFLRERLSQPAQLAGFQPLRNSKVPHILKIRRFAGVFDGVFPAELILKTSAGFFRARIGKEQKKTIYRE